MSGTVIKTASGSDLPSCASIQQLLWAQELPCPETSEWFTLPASKPSNFPCGSVVVANDWPVWGDKIPTPCLKAGRWENIAAWSLQSPLHIGQVKLPPLSRSTHVYKVSPETEATKKMQRGIHKNPNFKGVPVLSEVTVEWEIAQGRSAFRHVHQNAM